MSTRIHDIFIAGYFSKISNNALQLVSGHRSEVIQQRREAILVSVKDLLYKGTLRNTAGMSQHVWCWKIYMYPRKGGRCAKALLASCDATSEQMSWNVSHSSSEVRTSDLEAGLEKLGNSPTMDNWEPLASTGRCINWPTSSKTVRNDSGSVQMWEWGEYLKEWSDQRKSFLMAS